MLNFDLSKKGQGLASTPLFVYDVLKKSIFLKLNSIYWQNFIVSLSSLLDIWANMFIGNVNCPVFKVIYF